MSDDNSRENERRSSKDITVSDGHGDREEELESENTDEEQSGGPEIREEISHLKTGTIPAIVMLLGGLATSVYCFARQYDVLLTLELVLAALVIFLILGGIVKAILDKIAIKKTIIVDVPEEEDEEEEAGETEAEEQE